MNESLQRPIRKFNPGIFQSDQEVIDQFVARKNELRVVLETLRENTNSPSCQHILVVAPRGQGKSMLLARVAAELHVNNQFAELLPVRFMEESHEIFDMADFWFEMLLHLPREIAESHPELSQELRTTHASLPSRWQEEALEEHAHAAVQEAANNLGRKLVLMVENLQALCGTTNDDFGWKLRASLQTEPRIMLLATATSRFAELEDANDPFFELFRFINLEPLNTPDCRRLWQMICGDGKTAHENKIRALEILTGGNPRLLVIVGEFARHRSLRELMEDLIELIDNHTEYFRSRLEALPKTERRVYLAVIDLWQRSSASEIAERARMDVRTVSSLLVRLIRRGAITSYGSDRKRRYSATERLHSIYYKLRHERDEAAVVQNLVHFMVAFYSEEREWEEMFNLLTFEAEQSTTIREGIKRAITELLRDTDDASERSGPETLDQALDAGKRQIKQQIKKAEKSFHSEKYAKCIAIIDEILSSWPLYRMPALLFAQVLHHKAFSHDQLGDHDKAVETVDRLLAQFRDVDAPDIQNAVAAALCAKGLFYEKADDHEAAIKAYSEVLDQSNACGTEDLQQWEVRALVGRSEVKRKNDDFEGALSDHEQIVEIFGTRHESIFQIYVSQALVATGFVHEALGNTEKAISIYDEVMHKYGSSSVQDVQANVATASHCKRMCKLWLHCVNNQTESQWTKWIAHIQALLRHGNIRLAVKEFRSAYAAVSPNSEAALSAMMDIVIALTAAGAPASELVEILSGNSDSSDALFPLIVALRQHDDKDVRAPDEVLDVAKDIRARIHGKQVQHQPESSLAADDHSPEIC